MAASLCAISGPAWADNDVTVTSLVTPPIPTTNQWGTLPGENSAGSTTEINHTNVSDTDGSLHIAGDRTRVQTGIQYGGSPGLPTNTGILANDLVSLTADYIVNNGGNGGIQSPAFRILVQDGTQRSELIWEAAYNGGYTLGTLDSVSPTDLFWQYVAGCGATLVGGGCTNSGTYVMYTLADWGNLYSTGAFVTALSVGDGSGAGAAFDANVDNLALTTNALGVMNTSHYNFAAVPEPATWAMMLLGFGGIGISMRRRRAAKLPQMA